MMALSEFKRIGLKGKNIKCFREAGGFDDVKNINVIIGRNNSGKSTLIDMIDVAIHPDRAASLSGYLGNQPELVLTYDTEPEYFNKYCTGTSFNRGPRFNEFGKAFASNQVLDIPIVGAQPDRYISQLAEKLAGTDKTK